MSEVSTVLRDAKARSSSMTALSLAAASTASGASERIAPGMARSHMASRLGWPTISSICTTSSPEGPTWRLTKSAISVSDDVSVVTGTSWSIDIGTPGRC